jgi:hypothetical protein
MTNPWFRFYNEVLNDPKVQMLPAEVFKIWVNCLCHANSTGENDGKLGNVTDVSFALRVTTEAVSSAFQILMEKEIITEENGIYFISKWEKRQFKTDKYSESDNKFYVYFISDESLSEIKIGHSKNPWSRLSNVQTGSSKKLKIVATIKTTESGYRWLSDHFGSCKLVGEWFTPDNKMISLINALNSKNIKSEQSSVVKWLENYVATTTEQNRYRTDTEQKAAQQEAALPKVKTYFSECREYILTKFPNLETSDGSPIHLWEKSGYDLEFHIKPVIAAKAARGSKPGGFNYFTPAIENAHQAKMAEAPRIAQKSEITQETIERDKAFFLKTGIQHPFHNPEGIRA